ncbi:MAG TPA: Ig-like domain-containing protein, partial [Pyrinomonadaceae bacterium]|nr:Ig-like domain-containing protein [Pyrinomonadaceae bacterium]
MRVRYDSTLNARSRTLSAALSSLLTTALILIPALPPRPAQAAAGARSLKPADAGAERSAAASPAALAAPLVPSLSATKTDSFPDPDGDGKAEEGDIITYTVTITNNGTDATNVQFSDNVDPNTTLFPGSVSTQPIARGDSYNVLGNVRIQPDASSGLLANDCDPDNGPGCSSAGLTASGPTSSTAGGNVTVNSNGSFSYNPPAGFVGADSFQYTVTDGTGKTDMATASFTVSNMVWFVDNAATAGGDGRLTSPFNSLASVSGASDPDGPGEIIYVLEGSGPYGGGIALEAGQRLVGQGIGLDAALASFGISAPAHSDARPAATGKPVLANAAGDVIVLAGGNLVTFLDASATAAGSSAVSAAGAGSNTLSNVGLSAAGSANGVSAVNVSGSLSVASSTVSATSSGAAVSVSGGSGTIGFSSTAVSQNGGRVVDVQNRTGGSVSFDTSSTVTGTNGATDAVSLLGNSGGSTVTFSGPVHINTTSAGARGLVADSGGSFTLNMTSGANTVSSTGGAAVDIESLAVNIAFATTFSTNSTGRGLRADGVSGTASFGNTAINSSANTGVLLTGNSAAITFADLDIAPAAGVRALHALDNTGAVSSTSGVIIATGATAVEIDGPASRTPLNVVLTSVSADGTATGILVRDTSDGGNGFRVVGTLTTDGSGGAVTNITNRGADFFNAEDVRLGNMTFTNVGTTNGADPTNPASACGDISPTGGGNAGCAAGVHADTVTNLRLANIDMSGGNQQGVNLLNVTDFLLADSNITNMGDQVREDGLRARNLLGTAEISNTIFSGNKEAQAHIEMVSGTLAGLSVTGSTFSNSTGPVGNHGLRFQAWDGSSSKLSVANSTFSSLFSNGIQALATDTASMEVSVTGSTFTNWGSSAIVLIQDKSANVRFNIANNPSFTRSAASTGTSHVIVVNRLTTSLLGSSIQGAITGNTIGDSTSNTSASVGGSGIDINGLGSGTTTVLVQNNNIRGVANRGMTLNMAESNTGSNRLNATVTGNTVSVTNPTGFEGIFVQAGSLTGNSGILCAEIANNQSSSAATNGLRTRQRFLTTFQLRGYTGANNSNTSVITYLQAQNPSLGDTVTADNSVSTGGGGYVNTPGGAQCAQPVLPSAPLPSLSASLDADALGAPQHEQTAAVKTYSAGGEFTPLRKVRRGLAHSERGQVLGAGLADETAKAAPAAAAVAPAVSGGNVNVNIGTLPAGDSVTITFQVQVSEPFTGSQPQVSNQGTVTADGGISIDTDDPSVGANTPGEEDPTVTPILLRPTVNINDATVTEPASGSASASFTVTLSHAYTQPVSVSFATAAGGANPATAGTDYTAASGTVNFAVGETFQTVNVPALADLDAGETDETFLVNLSAATNGTIGDGQATGTITDTSVASPVIISELRTSGPDGSGDDFVELLNT